MPRCLMAKKWKAAPAAELGDETDEEIDVVGDGRGRSPAPAATAPGPPPRDPEPTLLYNAADLQAAYNQIKESGKNNVEGIVHWLQESKVIDKAKENADKIRSYFADAADKNNITADNFKEAMTKLASDQQKNVEELSKNLSEYGTKFLNALQVGASAFEEAMANK